MQPLARLEPPDEHARELRLADDHRSASCTSSGTTGARPPPPRMLTMGEAAARTTEPSARDGPEAAVGGEVAVEAPALHALGRHARRRPARREDPLLRDEPAAAPRRRAPPRRSRAHSSARRLGAEVHALAAVVPAPLQDPALAARRGAAARAPSVSRRVNGSRAAAARSPASSPARAASAGVLGALREAREERLRLEQPVHRVREHVPPGREERARERGRGVDAVRPHVAVEHVPALGLALGGHEVLRRVAHLPEVGREAAQLADLRVAGAGDERDRRALARAAARAVVRDEHLAEPLHVAAAAGDERLGLARRPAPRARPPRGSRRGRRGPRSPTWPGWSR